MTWRATKMSTKNRAELIETIWACVQKEEEGIPESMRTPKKDIEEAVFEIDGELRISGETGNNFSDMYVNYWDGEIQADELLFYLGEHGFETDWHNPGYMVVGVNEMEKLGRKQFISAKDALAFANEIELAEIDEFDRDAIGESIRCYESCKRMLWKAYEKGKEASG